MSNKIDVVHGWMCKAIADERGVRASFNETKNRIINVGFSLYKARECCITGNLGDFNDYIALYEKQISPITVYRYLKFVEDVAEWARRENLKLTLEEDFDKLIEIGRGMVMKSPISFTALCRQLELMHKNGGYTPDINERRKQLALERQSGRVYQVEFNFAAMNKVLDIVEQNISDAIAIAPEEIIKLEERIHKLQALLAEAKARQGAVDVGGEEKLQSQEAK